MNLELEGSPVALIVEDGKKKNSVISVDNDISKVNHHFNEFKCKPNQHIQQLPDVSKKEPSFMLLVCQAVVNHIMLKTLLTNTENYFQKEKYSFLVHWMKIKVVLTK